MNVIFYATLLYLISALMPSLAAHLNANSTKGIFLVNLQNHWSGATLSAAVDFK